jgi:hypothetical protein
MLRGRKNKTATKANTAAAKQNRMNSTNEAEPKFVLPWLAKELNVETL